MVVVCQNNRVLTTFDVDPIIGGPRPPRPPPGLQGASTALLQSPFQTNGFSVQMCGNAMLDNKRIMTSFLRTSCDPVVIMLHGAP